MGDGYDKRKLDEVVHNAGPPLVTICRYGSLVMSFNDLIVVDADDKPTGYPGEALRYGLGIASDYASVLDVGIRVYRTFKGHRWIIDSERGKPTTKLLNEYPCDEVYSLLCELYGNFRARLTPKVWRIDGWNISSEPEAWKKRYTKGKPLGASLAVTIMTDLEYGEKQGHSFVLDSRLQELQKTHTVFHYLGRAGEAQPLPELAPLIAAHDAWGDNSKPLA